MRQKGFRNGVAMVELIFAIVVIGIVLLSTPMLIQQSVNSTYVALQQESIAAVASHTGVVLTKHWDNANADPANAIDGVSPIVEVNTSTLDYSGLSGSASVRTTLIANTEINYTTSLGFDEVNETKFDFDDVDDITGKDITLTLYNGEATSNDHSVGIGDYVDKEIIITTHVNFVNDRPTAFTPSTTFNINPTATLTNGSHIKLIKSELTTKEDTVELNKSITLHAFSCNLGTYSIEGEQY